MACLDTSFLIDLASRNATFRKRAQAKLAELISRPEILATTRFNLAELHVGIARSDDPPEEEAKVRRLVAGLTVIEFDDRAARLFGLITAHLQTRGKAAGDMDVLIAASALSAGHSVVTRNADHFANMPGVIVEEY